MRAKQAQSDERDLLLAIGDNRTVAHQEKLDDLIWKLGASGERDPQLLSVVVCVRAGRYMIETNESTVYLQRPPPPPLVPLVLGRLTYFS